MIACGGLQAVLVHGTLGIVAFCIFSATVVSLVIWSDLRRHERAITRRDEALAAQTSIATVFALPTGDERRFDPMTGEWR